jgi:hypothetical protein|tara:strand:- start:513 stop:632 length:120 start_codon:yes stop_codon:yes gene_type:complete
MPAASSGQHPQGAANEPEKKYMEIKKELYQEFKAQSHSL